MLDAYSTNGMPLCDLLHMSAMHTHATSQSVTIKLMGGSQSNMKLIIPIGRHRSGNDKFHINRMKNDNINNLIGRYILLLIILYIITSLCGYMSFFYIPNNAL